MNDMQQESKHLRLLQLSLYACYTSLMTWPYPSSTTPSEPAINPHMIKTALKKPGVAPAGGPSVVVHALQMDAAADVTTSVSVPHASLTQLEAALWISCPLLHWQLVSRRSVQPAALAAEVKHGTCCHSIIRLALL
jgi:hypothetical protein